MSAACGCCGTWRTWAPSPPWPRRTPTRRPRCPEQLAALQREAGVPLLEHIGRRVSLTPAGTALVQHAETVLAALEAAAASLAAARSGVSGNVRIGAFPSAVRTLLPAGPGRAGPRLPALELMVTELDPVNMPGALRERSLDVALLHDYDITPAGPDPTAGLGAAARTRPCSWPCRTAGAGRAAPERDPDRGGTATATGSSAVPARCATPSPCASARRPASTPGSATTRTTSSPCSPWSPPGRASRWSRSSPPRSRLPGSACSRSRPPRRTRLAYRRGAGAHPTIAACVEALRTSTGAYLRHDLPNPRRQAASCPGRLILIPPAAATGCGGGGPGR